MYLRNDLREIPSSLERKQHASESFSSRRCELAQKSPCRRRHSRTRSLNLSGPALRPSQSPRDLGAVRVLPVSPPNAGLGLDCGGPSLKLKMALEFPTRTPALVLPPRSEVCVLSTTMGGPDTIGQPLRKDFLLDISCWRFRRSRGAYLRFGAGLTCQCQSNSQVGDDEGRPIYALNGHIRGRSRGFYFPLGHYRQVERSAFGET